MLLPGEKNTHILSANSKENNLIFFICMATFGSGRPTISMDCDLTLVGIDKRLAYRSCLLIKDCCFCIESTSHEVISGACQQLKSCRTRQLPALDMFETRLAMRQAALAE